MRAGRRLLGTLLALGNVALPLLYRGVPRWEQRRSAQEVLERVGLSERMHHRPSRLSGGQQQRVAIAWAIVAGAPIVIAHEPTGSLHSQVGREIVVSGVPAGTRVRLPALPSGLPRSVSVEVLPAFGAANSFPFGVP